MNSNQHFEIAITTLLRIADDWRLTAEGLEEQEKQVFLRYINHANPAEVYKHIPLEELLQTIEWSARARAFRSCEERIRREFEGNKFITPT